MKRTALVVAIILLVLFLGARPADAFIEMVFAPETVETGTPFSIMVSGSLSDPCWEVVNQRQITTEGVITFDVFTAYTAAPGVGCIQVLVPYDVFEEMTIPSEGLWLLRIIEHRYSPYGPEYPDQVWDVEITATGTVAMEEVSWGTLRTRYR